MIEVTALKKLYFLKRACVCHLIIIFVNYNLIWNELISKYIIIFECAYINTQRQTSNILAWAFALGRIFRIFNESTMDT